MKLGNRIYQIIILCFFFFNYSNADEKITTTPLINIDQIKPSFEELIDENEKVFIFNGWTFASDPSLTPFDHAIYDLQLINCSNV